MKVKMKVKIVPVSRDADPWWSVYRKGILRWIFVASYAYRNDAEKMAQHLLGKVEFL